MKIKNSSDKAAVSFRVAGGIFQVFPGNTLEVPEIHPKELVVILKSHPTLSVIGKGGKEVTEVLAEETQKPKVDATQKPTEAKQKPIAPPKKL